MDTVLHMNDLTMPHNTSIKTIVVPNDNLVPNMICTIKTKYGGKDYHENLAEYLCLKFSSFCTPLEHPKLQLEDVSHIYIQNFRVRQILQNKKAIGRKTISYVIVPKAESSIDESLLKRLFRGGCNNKDSGVVSLKEGLQFLSEDEREGEILFLICEGHTQTVTLAGSDDIIHLVGEYLGVQQDKEDTPEPKVSKGTSDSVDSLTTDCSRQGLAIQIVESVLERTGRGYTNGIKHVLEECLCSNLKQCEEWTTSLLTDLLILNASEQYIRDINDHVIDYLTQSFRQKHSMLAMQDKTEYEDTVCKTPSHVTVLQKLSPTLFRQFRLEGTNLLDYLIEEDALSDTERQSILAQPTDKRKNEVFIDHLCANYSKVNFKNKILPILHKDEDNRHIADVIEKELERGDVGPEDNRCTFCKVKGLIDLRALSEHLLSQNSITQNTRRDLCSPTMSARLKWEELLENVDELPFLTALKTKYPHFYDEFQDTGHKPMRCCCDEVEVTLRRDVPDVANMDDLASEISGSRISVGLRDSVVDRLSQMSPALWKTEGVAGYRHICGICHQKIRDNRKLTCGHIFCKVCIGNVLRVVKLCPVCGSRLGSISGTMPPGSMTHRTEKSSLPGFSGFDTIVISYHIEDGVQTDDHPCPGHPYRGVSCTSYIPNSLDGQIVLMLLQTAWDRGLTFTLRQSVSSCRDYILSWNGISHKTNRYGGPKNNGYPDTDYLSRLRRELSDQSILAEDLRSTMV